MKNTSKQYWQMVWREIKKRAWKEADMRGHIIGFSGIVFYGVVLSILYKLGYISATFFSNQAANVLFEVSTIAIPIAIYSIIIVISLSKFPAEIYFKQKDTIELLENRLASGIANISVEKYERPKNYPYPNRAGILVLNNENCDLTDVYVKLISMKQIELHETEDWHYYDEERIISLDENNKEFELEKESVIKAKDEKVFLLAKIQDDKNVVFLLKNKPYKAIYNYSIPHDGYITYKSRWEMEFDVRGKKEGKPFSERYFISIKANRQVPIYENEIADKVSIETSEVIHIQKESGVS